MKCPICDYQVPDKELRCPQCHKALTSWKNLNDYAEEAFAAGMYALDTATPESAAELFLRAIVFAPGQARYLSVYGRVLVQLSRPAEAVEVLAKVVELDPSPQNKKDLDAARDAADKAASDEATPPFNFEPLALGAISDEGDEVADPWKTALFVEQNWNQFAPFAGILSLMSDGEQRSATGAYLLGLSALHLGAVEEARTHFRSAAKLDSSLANPDIYLLFLAEGGEVDDEISHLQALGRSGGRLSRCLELAAEPYLARQPDDAHLRLLRAIHLAKGERAALCRKLADACRTPRALEAACTAWEQLPFELEVVLLAGDKRAQLKQSDRAEQLYCQALVSCPDHWAPRERLAILLQDRDPEAAIAYLKEALTLAVAPDERAELLWLQASILMQREACATAREALEELVALQPDSAEYRTALDDCRRAEAMSSATADLPSVDIKDSASGDKNPSLEALSLDRSMNPDGTAGPPKSSPN